MEEYKKRFYICCDDPFPYGTANSNYIRNLARLLTELGFSVFVIALRNKRKNNSELYEAGQYKGIKYININLRKSRIPFRLRNHCFFGGYLNKVLDKHNLSAEDYLLIYSDYISVSCMALKNYSNLNRNGHLIYCIVEWFQSYQYSLGIFNLDYQLWKYQFLHLFPKYRKVIPISRNLGNYFSEKKALVCVVPCLVDTEESGRIYKQTHDKEKFQFIYSGNAINKDALGSMIRGLLVLEQQYRERMTLHFTTMTPETLMRVARCSEDEFKILEKCLVYHGWLEYDQLIDLYKKMDYLFLPREDNIVTKSNFPSKVTEMLCYGIVPVCSEVGDYTDLYLTDEFDAIVFQGATPEDCALGLRRAIEIGPEKLMQMQINARKCVEEKLDFRRWKEPIYRFLNDSEVTCEEKRERYKGGE